jgi:hypothetical protein
LDCLGQAAFAAVLAPEMVLEKLGFPWILSSEMSLFNGLRENFSKNFFMRLLRDEGRKEALFVSWWV